MLEIENLEVSIEETAILKGFSLGVNLGEIHAIMGPNGAGKSTLAKVLAGDPAYEVKSGSARLEGEDLLQLDPDERSRKGLFMSFQYPIEIPGISNFEFLMSAYNAHQETPVSEEVFREIVERIAGDLKIPEGFLERDLNCGFSGGEKKRNEILQMAVLDPKLVILDETDSGLDIDALNVVSEGVNRFMDESKGLIVITHYPRILSMIQPDFVHVMVDGKIVESGTFELAKRLEEKGYALVT